MEKIHALVDALMEVSLVPDVRKGGEFNESWYEHNYKMAWELVGELLKRGYELRPRMDGTKL